MTKSHLLLLPLLLLPLTASAKLPEAVIKIKNNLFVPQTITIPANKKIRLTFINQDKTPEEIDSFDLNRWKVIFGNSRGSIFVGPLPPGEYSFFGEYHPNTAVGTVIVVNEEKTNAH